MFFFAETQASNATKNHCQSPALSVIDFALLSIRAKRKEGGEDGCFRQR